MPKQHEVISNVDSIPVVTQSCSSSMKKPGNCDNPKSYDSIDAKEGICSPQSRLSEALLQGLAEERGLQSRNDGRQGEDKISNKEVLVLSSERLGNS